MKIHCSGWREVGKPPRSGWHGVPINVLQKAKSGIIGLIYWLNDWLQWVLFRANCPFVTIWSVAFSQQISDDHQRPRSLCTSRASPYNLWMGLCYQCYWQTVESSWFPSIMIHWVPLRSILWPFLETLNKCFGVVFWQIASTPQILVTNWTPSKIRYHLANKWPFRADLAIKDDGFPQSF